MARTTRRASMAIVAISTLLLAACGGDDSGTVSEPDDDASAIAAPAGLVSDGTLTVCSDTPYEPFEFKDDSGTDTGYDMDLLRAVAERAELDMTVKDLPFDGILGSLTAGDCDVVASAVTIKPERAEQVDFTEPYFDADQSLLVKTAEAGEHSALDKLAGKTIGVQSGTTGETYAKEHTPEGATVKGFEDSDGLFAAIAAGDIAGILQDLPVNAYRATQDTTLQVVETFKTGEQYGFAVKKGNAELLGFLDDGLAALRANGEFNTIYTRYFGSVGG